MKKGPRLHPAVEAERPVLAVFVSDEETRDAVSATLEVGWPGATITQGSIDDAIHHVSIDPSARILIVDISGTSDPLAALGRLAEVCAPGTFVVALGDNNDVGFYRTLRRTGIADYLVKPITAEALGAALQAIRHHSATPEPEKAGRPRGRPALPPEKGKRYSIGIRSTKELKEKLEQAARRSGRSLAAEIEHQLERALSAEGDAAGVLALLLGDAPTAGLLISIGRIMSDAHRRARELGNKVNWFDHPAIFQFAREGIEDFLEAVGPIEHEGARETTKPRAQKWEQPSLGLPRTTASGAPLDPVEALLGERLVRRLERAHLVSQRDRWVGNTAKNKGEGP